MSAAVTRGPFRTCLIAVLLAAATVVAIVMVLRACGSAPSRGSARGVVHRLEATQREEVLRLGNFQRVLGRELHFAPLEADSEGSRLTLVSSSYGRRPIRNFLFFDASSGESWWLRDARDWDFTSTHRIVERPDEADKGAVLGFVFTVRERDSNANGRFDSDDVLSVWVSGADGKDLRRVVEAADDVLGILQHDARRTVVFYVSEGGHHALRLDEALQPIDVKRLPFGR